MLATVLSKIISYVNPVKIPDIIPYLIGKDLETYLNIRDLRNIKLVNKELNHDIYLQKELKFKLELLSNYFQKMNKIINTYQYFNETFFPKKLIKLLPVLPWKHNYMGCTDYIDRIKATDLIYPIMIGVDHFHRPFITIKYKTPKKIIFKNKLLKTLDTKCYITVFQRYTDNKKCWVKCNTKGPLMIYDGSSVFTDEDKALFINNTVRLLCGKKIIINDRDSWMSDVQTQKEIDCKLY